MNKRLGFLSLIGVAALLLATFGANALAAPSGVAGTVTFDRSWTNLDNTIKVTVTDDDENVATLTVEDEGVAGTPRYAVIVNAPAAYFPAAAPIADWGGIDQLVDPADTTDTDDDENTSVDVILRDLNAKTGISGIDRARFFQAAGASGDTDQAKLDDLNDDREGNGITINDVLVITADANVVPAVVAIGSTSATITATSGTANSSDFAMVYFGSLPDMVTAKVRSTSDQNGITLDLEETGLNTGVFDETFDLGASSNDDTDVLKAAKGDVITVSYTDASEDVTRTATLSVELGAPKVSNLTPASGTHTNGTTVVLTGDLVDAQSGVKAKTIRFYLDVGGGPVEIPDKDKSDSGDFSNDEYNRNEITGGVQASVEVTLDPPSGVTVYKWYLSGEDNAGNPGRSDANAKEEGDSAHSLTYDKQSVTLKSADDDKANAILGQWWDTTKKDDPDTDEVDERLITDVTKAKNTSIRVIFDGALDGDSVDAGDFTVDGAAVDAADWFSSLKDSVFLTVGEKGPSETPKVEVASGGIRDAAGNANSTALTVKKALDGLAPTFTVDVAGDDTGGVAVSGDEITITVTANETLITNPTIEYGAVAENADGDLEVAKDANDDPDLTEVVGLTFKGSDQWEGTVDVNGIGAFVVMVTGEDTASNEGVSGGTDPEKSSAILFETDNAIPDPVLDPDHEGSVSRSDPFLSIDWSSEGEEYAGDTHKKVTLTVLTLDGEDVLGRAATSDNRSFILTTSDLALGDHKIEVNGMDESGNELDGNHKVTFTVKASPATKIELKPGMNLISFPGTPADTSINSVVTLSQVSAISTYDAATGTWLSATRDESGLSGSLEQIDAQHAYWVSTTSFDPIEVDIPRQGFGNVPPAITLVEGWNLVPVVVVGNQTVKTIAADTYFGSTSWVTAYTFDPQEGQWTKVLPGNFHDVEVGKGYWLYVEQAGVLVP